MDEYRKELISSMIDAYLLETDCLKSTNKLLIDIKRSLGSNCILVNNEKKIIISTLFKILRPKVSLIAICIDRPSEGQQVFSLTLPFKSFTEEYYQAIYTGLTTLFDLNNRPEYPVEVHVEDKLIVEALENSAIPADKKRNYILEYISALPVKVSFKWRPLYSTKAMTRLIELKEQEEKNA